MNFFFLTLLGMGLSQLCCSPFPRSQTLIRAFPAMTQVGTTHCFDLCKILGWSGFFFVGTLGQNALVSIPPMEVRDICLVPGCRRIFCPTPKGLMLLFPERGEFREEGRVLCLCATNKGSVWFPYLLLVFILIGGAE